MIPVASSLPPPEGGARSNWLKWDTALLCAAAALLLTLIVRTAWVCDDAYITIRTIDNWRMGYGLRWNVAERVQSFTHPLWLLAEAAVWQLTGEPYFSSMALSILCAACAVTMLATSTRPLWLSAAAVFLLSASQAFVDYATSGLETPLTYLLLVAFLIAYWRMRPSPRYALIPAALAALLGVNRLDTLLLVTPALLHVAWIARRDAKRLFAAGWLPLLGWEAFSIAYYGFPVPNTAYAKLATGIPQSDLTAQGFAYLWSSWRVDPVTLGVIGGAVILAVYRPRLETGTLAAGLLLHLLYVVRIGGDFMNGRFLVPAFLLAVGILLRHPRAHIERVVIAAIMFAVAATQVSHAVARAWPARPFPPIDALIDDAGVADERMVYFRETSLLDAIRHRAEPDPNWMRSGRYMTTQGVRVLAQDSVGFFGYGAGPTVHVVDTLALGDPLLARLPALQPWRIGHFYRDIPAGYLEMLRGEQDHLDDPALNQYYAAIRLVTRGPLWSRERWAAIVSLNVTRAYEEP
jgi:arabinofuranosyltransferase